MSAHFLLASAIILANRFFGALNEKKPPGSKPAVKLDREASTRIKETLGMIPMAGIDAAKLGPNPLSYG